MDQIKKDELEVDLINALLDAANQKQITLQEVQTIAKEILPSFQGLSSEESLLSFLDMINTKWPFFNALYLKHKAPVQSKSEQEVMNKLSSYINSQK